ncbi:MAG: UDP-N-acetylmuramate--L-alanine ligase [Candidatus Omnitrophica bacterium]|nr:UDP-N-acetylmuramate--L-alanine ligase [Candidatus Omnitrophota bacterium]
MKNIHFVGIGGIGMSGLAFLLKDQGVKVRGSDSKSGCNVDNLRAEGVEVIIGHKASNIDTDTDLVAYSSAIRMDNPEIVEAKKQGIKIIKRGTLLGCICQDKKTIAVSGSHGKTTTTSFLAYLLTALGYDPALFIGGLPLNHSRNARWGKDYFVIETDESDGSFLNHHPWVSIITNVDNEHIEHYKSWDNLKQSFLKFARQTTGKVFGCGDDQTVREILDQVEGIKYGFGPDNDIRCENVSFDGTGSSFDLLVGNKRIPSIKTPLFGEHNVLNTLAVLAVSSYLGDDLESIAKVMKDFKGTKRRFQVQQTLGGITFVDDYAHHPTEIKAVLKASCKLKPERMIVVFQPHRFSRVKALYDEFCHCFCKVDRLIVTDIYGASEDSNRGVEVKEFCSDIAKNTCADVQYIPKEFLAKEVPLLLKSGDLCLSLGAGDINSLIAEVAREVKEKIYGSK